ncbi:hypothetical protein [Ewingella allii]|uniref:hypothetical protein n=1 Tax=Ewingella allii TaxID=3092550 RepID=UPI003795F4D7
MTYNFKEHLQKASYLYQQGDNSSLRYCALELRLAIECHVYNQLKASLGKIPESVINTWQPPQAIKSLCMFEDAADMDLEVQISGEEIENITVKYKNIKYQDLNKWYNTLGSYLHQPTIKKQNFAIDKGKLHKIQVELSKLCDFNLITFSRGYNKIKCEKCGQDILFTNDYLKKNNKLNCQNAGCKNYAVIRLSSSEEVESFQYARIPCFKCGTKHSILLCEIDAESEFTCRACKNKHFIKKFINSDGRVVPVPEFSFESTLQMPEDESDVDG